MSICINKHHTPHLFPLHDNLSIFILRATHFDRFDVNIYASMLHDVKPGLEFPHYKLHELCNLFIGSTPKEEQKVKSGIALLKTKNVYTGQLDLGSVDYIGPQVSKKNSILCSGDILITIIGASFDVIGRCLVYRNYPYPAKINQNIIGIRIKKSLELDPDFLCLQLNSLSGQKQIQQKAQRTAQCSLNKTIMKNFEIFVPSLAQQQLIVARFENIKKHYEQLIQRAELVRRKSETAFSLVREQIEQFIGQSLPKPYQNLVYLLSVADQKDRLDVMGANLEFEKACAESGKFIKLSKWCTINSGGSSGKGKHDFLSIENAPGDWWDTICPETVVLDSVKQVAQFKAGDIAFANLKPSILKGKCFIVAKNCIGSPNYLVLDTHKFSSAKRLFLWVYLKMTSTKQFLANQCSGKSDSQKIISRTILANLPIPNLSDSELEQLKPVILKAQKLWRTKKLAANIQEQAAKDMFKEANDDIFALLDEEHYQALLKRK